MNNSFPRIFKSRSVGLIAAEILTKDQDARIFGKSSRGIFIKTASRWLVYLSFDHFQGPLTITIEEVDPILQHASAGKAVRIISQSLHFPDLDTIISIQGGETWQPLGTQVSHLFNSGCYVRLALLAQDMLAKATKSGLEHLLPPLLGSSENFPDSKKKGLISWEDIQRLQEYLRNGDADPLACLLADHLGSGPGLTPSVDDFALGILLTLNRWSYPNWVPADLQALNHRIVKAAYANTTTLSANLIECATLGLADERLINILDWLVTGAYQKPEMVEYLLNWGNSSGFAAFTGMAVTLTA